MDPRVWQSLDGASFRLSSKLCLCKYRPDWFAGVLFPLGAATVSGLVVYLLNLLLSGVAGAVLCIVISLPVGVFFHILFLVILRVIGETELQEMPLGFLFIMLGRTIGVF